MKIAVLLPNDYDRTTVLKARALVKATLRARPLGGARLRVVVGLPQGDETAWRRNEAEFKAVGREVTVRHLLWESVAADNADRMFSDFRRPYVLHGLERVVLPRDWGTNFTDCDYWFSLAHPGQGALYALRPTAHFCGDLDMRRHPGAFAKSIDAPFWREQEKAFSLWRSGGVVVTSGAANAADVTAYAGVHPDSVIQIPSLFDPPPSLDTTEAERLPRRLLWLVEPNMAYDLEAAAEGLRIYRAEGGQLEPLILCETMPQAFGKGSNVMDVVALSGLTRSFLAKLPIEQLISTPVFRRLCTRSSFLWSSRLVGGEGLAAREALAYGLHVLTPRANATQDVAANGALHFYEAGNAENIENALCDLEALIGKPPPATANEAPDVASVHIGFVLDRLMELVDG